VNGFKFEKEKGGLKGGKKLNKKEARSEKTFRKKKIL
jgi:hypothetical protein